MRTMNSATWDLEHCVCVCGGELGNGHTATLDCKIKGKTGNIVHIKNTSFPFTYNSYR